MVCRCKWDSKREWERERGGGEGERVREKERRRVGRELKRRSNFPCGFYRAKPLNYGVNSASWARFATNPLESWRCRRHSGPTAGPRRVSTATCIQVCERGCGGVYTPGRRYFQALGVVPRKLRCKQYRWQLLRRPAPRRFNCQTEISIRALVGRTACWGKPTGLHCRDVRVCADP